MTSRLKEERKRLGLTQKSVIDKCEVTKQTVIRWESGAAIPSDKMEKLVEIGIDVLFLITGNKNKTSVCCETQSDVISANDFTVIPVLDVHASAGNGLEVVSEETSESLVLQKNWLIKKKLYSPNLVMIYAKGDSMAPTIYSGDELLIDKTPLIEYEDGLYVFRVGNDLLVKRIQKEMNGKVNIISDNPSYKSYSYEKEALEEIHIVGKVVWHGHALGQAQA